MRKRTGRPSKLTPELSERLCAYIRAGNYKRAAAAACGISEGTLYEWVKKGEAQANGQYHEFAEALKRAEAESEAAIIATIRQDPSWQSKAWIAERRWPDRWGRRERVQLEANVEAKMSWVDLVKQAAADDKDKAGE